MCPNPGGGGGWGVGKDIELERYPQELTISTPEWSCTFQEPRDMQRAAHQSPEARWIRGGASLLHILGTRSRNWETLVFLVVLGFEDFKALLDCQPLLQALCRGKKEKRWQMLRRGCGKKGGR